MARHKSSPEVVARAMICGVSHSKSGITTVQAREVARGTRAVHLLTNENHHVQA